MRNRLKAMWTALVGNTTSKDVIKQYGALATVINGYNDMLGNYDASDIYLHPVVNRCVTFIATNIAQLPLKLYKDNDIYTGIPAYDIYRPNDYQSYYDFIQLAVTHKIIYREIIIVKQLVGNNIVNMYVCNPSSCAPKLDKSGRIQSWRINRVVVPAEEVIYISDVALKGLRPKPLIDTLRDDFEADLKSSAFVKNYFKNFAQLGGYLYYDGDPASTPTPEQMLQLVETIDQLHSGSDKAYKLAGLTGGIKYQEIQQSIKDMEFNTSKDAIRDRILLHLGIPKSVVGVTDSVDRAVADTHLRQVWMFTLKPLAEQIEVAFNRSIYKPMGLECRFDYGEIAALKEDEAIKASIATQYLQLGYTRNEINDKLSMEFAEDPNYGNIRYIPASLIPVAYYDDDLLDDDNKNTGAGIEKTTEINTTKTINTVDKLYTHDYNRLQLKHEKLLRSKTRRYIYEQRGDVLQAIEQHGKKDVTKYSVLNIIKEIITKSTDKWLNNMKDLMSNTYMDGVALADKRLGRDEVGSGLDAQVIDDRTNLLRGVGDNTYKQLRKEIVDSINSGDSITTMADRIRGVYNVIGNTRSITIARTESAALLSMSTVKRYADAGVRYKSWSSPKSREAHFRNHAEGVVPWDHVFSSGERFPHDGTGGPSLEINCTCVCLPVFRD